MHKRYVPSALAAVALAGLATAGVGTTAQAATPTPVVRFTAVTYDGDFLQPDHGSISIGTAHAPKFWFTVAGLDDGSAKIVDQDGNQLCEAGIVAGPLSCTTAGPLRSGEYDLTVTAADDAGHSVSNTLHLGVYGGSAGGGDSDGDTSIGEWEPTATENIMGDWRQFSIKLPDVPNANRDKVAYRVTDADGKTVREQDWIMGGGTSTMMLETPLGKRTVYTFEVTATIAGTARTSEPREVVVDRTTEALAAPTFIQPPSKVGQNGQIAFFLTGAGGGTGILTNSADPSLEKRSAIDTIGRWPIAAVVKNDARNVFSFVVEKDGVRSEALTYEVDTRLEQGEDIATPNVYFGNQLVAKQQVELGIATDKVESGAYYLITDEKGKETKRFIVRTDSTYTVDVADAGAHDFSIVKVVDGKRSAAAMFHVDAE